MWSIYLLVWIFTDRFSSASTFEIAYLVQSSSCIDISDSSSDRSVVLLLIWGNLSLSCEGAIFYPNSARSQGWTRLYSDFVVRYHTAYIPARHRFDSARRARRAGARARSACWKSSTPRASRRATLARPSRRLSSSESPSRLSTVSCQAVRAQAASQAVSSQAVSSQAVRARAASQAVSSQAVRSPAVRSLSAQPGCPASSGLTRPRRP
jgi:hypothetical protein